MSPQRPSSNWSVYRWKRNNSRLISHQIYTGQQSSPLHKFRKLHYICVSHSLLTSNTNWIVIWCLEFAVASCGWDFPLFSLYKGQNWREDTHQLLFQLSYWKWVWQSSVALWFFKKQNHNTSLFIYFIYHDSIYCLCFYDSVLVHTVGVSRNHLYLFDFWNAARCIVTSIVGSQQGKVGTRKI